MSPDKGWQDFAAQSEHLVCVPDLELALSYFNETGRTVADRTMAMWKSGSAPELAAEVERAFEYLEDADVEADGASSFEYEGELVSAVMQYVKADTASAPIVIAADDDTVTFTTNVKAVVAFEANFSFYVRDSIDKDYVPLGSQPYSTEDEIEFELVVTVRRAIDAEPEVVDIEVAKKRLEVDFGYIEPFPNEDPTHEKY